MRSIQKPARPDTQHIQAKGYQCRVKRPQAYSPDLYAGYNLLRKTFHPLLKQGWEFYNRQKRVTDAFFSSVNNICALYNLPVPTSDLPYPSNIITVFRQIGTLLVTANPHATPVLVEQHKNKVVIATKEECSNRYELYYIPVKPVVDYLSDPATRPIAALFLSIFAWLYKIVRITYFTDPYSYICNIYDSINDNIQQEEYGFSPEELEAITTEMTTLATKGKMIRRLIISPKQLHEWQERIAHFVPSNEWERTLLQTSRKAYDLYLTYPKRTMFDNYGKVAMELPDFDDFFEPHQYTGFIWEYSGWSCDQLLLSVNSGQENSQILTPTGYQFFDQPHNKISHGLDFEEALFLLIEQITYLLTTNPKDERSNDSI